MASESEDFMYGTRVTPPAKVCKIIFVCVMLYNICKDRNIHILLEDGHGHGQPPAEDNIHMAANDKDDHEEEDGDQAQPPPAGYHARVGLLYRDDFARLYFN